MKAFLAGFLAFLMTALLADFVTSLMNAFYSNLVTSLVITFCVDTVFYYCPKLQITVASLISKLAHSLADDYLDISIP